MATAGSIEFQFRGDLGPLKRDMSAASRLAKDTANEISRSTRSSFNGRIAGAFRRTPERRAERAISELGAGLLTGDIGTAIASFTGKITAFGLAAGVGVGVAIDVFQKFHKEITETSNAFDSLKQNMGRPFGLQSALGPDALTSEIEDGNKKLEAALEKRATYSSKIDEFLHRGTLGGQSDTRFGGNRAESSGPDLAQTRDEIIKESEERLSKLASIRADKELQIANLKLKSAQGYEKEAALAKITLDAEEKRAALLLSRHGNALDLFKSKLAIDVEAEAERLQVEKKFPAPAPPPQAEQVGFNRINGTGGLMGGNNDTLIKYYSDGTMRAFRGGMEEPGGEGQVGFHSWSATGGLTGGNNAGREVFYKDGSRKTFIGGMERGSGIFPTQQPAPSDPEGGADQWKDIGTGLDGIKTGIDNLNIKMDKFWS